MVHPSFQKNKWRFAYSFSGLRGRPDSPRGTIFSLLQLFLGASDGPSLSLHCPCTCRCPRSSNAFSVFSSSWPDLQARICHLLADGPPARLTAPHTQCVFPAQPVVFPPRLAPHPSVAPSATLVAPARNLRISFESLPLTKTVSLPLDPVDSAP